MQSRVKSKVNMKTEQLTKPDRTTRRVVCAALRADDGMLLLGIRHCSGDMIQQIEARRDGYKFLGLLDENQGFVDQWGTFMSRGKAFQVAQKNGQIYDPTVGGVGLDGPKLYSECLY